MIWVVGNHPQIIIIIENSRYWNILDVDWILTMLTWIFKKADVDFQKRPQNPKHPLGIGVGFPGFPLTLSSL